MKYTLRRVLEKPLLQFQNDLSIRVNSDFINLTGFSSSELIGKSLAEIGEMLRINHQIQIENIQKKQVCYLFTKENEAKEVLIYCEISDDESKKDLFINKNSSLNHKEKFDFIKQLYLDSKIGISIISVPNLILLNANENYFSYLNVSMENNYSMYGKNNNKIIYEHLGTNAGENINQIWKKVMSSGKPFYKEEVERECNSEETTYWNISALPIFEQGKLQYIVNTVIDVTEKVIAKKRLNECIKVIEGQKEQLDAIFENINGAGIIVDKKRNVVKVNSIAKNSSIFKNIKLQNLDQIFKMASYFDRDGNQINIKDMPITKALSGEIVKNQIINIKMVNSELILECTAIPIRDSNGIITMGAAFFNNVTDLYNKEKIIKEQRDELDAIIENIYDALLIFDKHGNIKRVNKAAKQYHFYSEDINTMQNYHNYVNFINTDGSLISENNSLIKRIINGEKILRHRCTIQYNNQKTYIEINGNPIYDENNNFIAGILLVRNITDNLKSEENSLLKAQYDLISSIIENVDVSVVRYSYPEYKIIFINNKTYNDLKLINPAVKSISSVIGQNYFDIFINHKNKDKLKVIKNLSEKKGGQYFINRKDLKTGEEKFLKVIYKPLFGLNNQIYEIIVVTIDVTEEVIEKNKMIETLITQDEMFSNISHELKTPLNVIFSTNQLIEYYLKNELFETNRKKISKGINIIKQNCYRFTKIINNIIDISKIESGFFKLELSNQNIVNIIEEIVQSISEYIEGKGLNIIFDTNTEEKIIACDPNKIERIMLNLISNAIKFTDAGGSIFVTIEDNVDMVEISVRDTGIGMEKNQLEDIFKRFHQVDKSLSRNSGGSGIGLSIVNSIVCLHGGKVSAESKINEGSVFKINLPATTIKKAEVMETNSLLNNKIEMINIEFSDIYSI